MFKLTPERWREISPFLDNALSLSEGERAGWLKSFRVDQPELADLLQELLDEHRSLAQEHFLEEGPSMVSNHTRNVPLRPK
jgi:hypothetical protein